MVILGSKLFLNPSRVAHALPAQKGHLRAQSQIYRAKQRRKSTLGKWLTCLLNTLKLSSPEEPWRRASVPNAWLSLLPFFFFM